jgi:hypothetical protein
MKIREITTNLYEAPTFGQSLDSALAAGASRLRNATGTGSALSTVDRYMNLLKKSTYSVIFVKPIADYFLNMEQWESKLKDKPDELEQRRQIERGYLITELAAIAGTLSMGEVGIFLLSELFGFIPIIGPLIGRLFKVLGPAVQSAAMLWLSSDAGRIAIANLLASPLINIHMEDIPGYGSDIIEMFKKGFEWAKQHVEQGYHDITTPADPNAKPSTNDAVDPSATDPNDPWTIKPKTPTEPPKKKLDPSQMKQIVASTDDSAYTSLDRVVRGPDGQLHLK